MSETTPTPAAPRRFRLPVESILIGIGAVVLVLASYWLTASPRPDRSPAGSQLGSDAPRLAQLEQRLAALEAGTRRESPGLAGLEARLRGLEARPAAADPGARLAPLEQRLTALDSRLAALEARPAPPDPSPRLAALAERLTALEQPRDMTPAMEARFAEMAATLSGNARTIFFELQGELRAVATLQEKLAAGEAFGAALERKGAGVAALERFRTTAPPTPVSLRLDFAALVRQARGSLPGERPDHAAPGFWEAAWLKVQGLVTVRRGDRMLLGAAAEPSFERITLLLELGALEGAVSGLETVPPAARALFEPWAEQVRALLAARVALRRLATGED